MENHLYRFAQFLGHGRALEAYLTFMKLVFGIILLPGYPTSIRVLSDLQWFVPDPVIAAPFLLIAAVQGTGLWLNARGYEGSWVLRVVGATAALMLWSWMIAKSVIIGQPISVLTPIIVPSALASTFILWKAMNRLPVPGAVGLI